MSSAGGKRPSKPKDGPSKELSKEKKRSSLSRTKSYSSSTLPRSFSAKFRSALKGDDTDTPTTKSKTSARTPAVKRKPRTQSYDSSTLPRSFGRALKRASTASVGSGASPSKSPATRLSRSGSLTARGSASRDVTATMPRATGTGSHTARAVRKPKDKAASALKGTRKKRSIDAVKGAKKPSSSSSLAQRKAVEPPSRRKGGLSRSRSISVLSGGSSDNALTDPATPRSRTPTRSHQHRRSAQFPSQLQRSV